VPTATRSALAARSSARGEFTQAELEYFIDPEADEPDLSSVEDVAVTLYPTSEQNAEAGEALETTIGEAVEEGIITDQWVAYFLGVAKPWYESIGVDMDRFGSASTSQASGPTTPATAGTPKAKSMATGSRWPASPTAETTTSKHAEHSGDRFTIFRQYDEPKTVERATVDPDMSYLGPEFGGDAQAVVGKLEDLAARDRSAFEGAAQSARKRRAATGRSRETAIQSRSKSRARPTRFPSGRPASRSRRRPKRASTSPPRRRTLLRRRPNGLHRLHHAYREDEVADEERTFLELEPEVAPTFVGVFPLQSDDELEAEAEAIAEALREAGLSVTYDDSGNIGRRYRRQDEVGTPFCVTVDYESIEQEDGGVTVRERDSTEQKRLPIEDLPETLSAIRAGDLEFDEL